MIKEAYCSFEVSKLLKEKGFDAQFPYLNVLKKLKKYPPGKYTAFLTC